MNDPWTNAPMTISTDTAAELRHYLANDHNIECLYGILRSYIRKSGLVSPDDEDAVNDTTYELLQNLVLKAFELVEKYHGSGLRAWLLSIAQNLLKQRRAEWARHHQRETSLSELSEHPRSTSNESEFFDLFTQPALHDPAHSVEIREQLRGALACLSQEDQQIITLNLHYGFHHTEIARLLGITSVAARVRFSRALDRLRNAWNAQEDHKRGESDV
ncbi:MAG TPA: sigma-70 family RNA polymerase sigma factor [Ktedonobacteraceae bacterium]